MVFLDSNLFIVDRFFPRDKLHAPTRSFLGRVGEISAAIPFMTLLEICGAASFRLSAAETERWLHAFATMYAVNVVNPFGAGDEASAAWLGTWFDDVARYVARKMTFGDAVLAREADRYGATALVTWNVKDFDGRTAVPVVAPDEFFDVG